MIAASQNTAYWVMRRRLEDLFSEVSCYSAKAANALLAKYPTYRQALDDPAHAFWGRDASKMLNEASAVEYRLMIAEQSRSQSENISYG